MKTVRHGNSRTLANWFCKKECMVGNFFSAVRFCLKLEDIQAEEVLTELINDQPDFAEAWNRRAVLYYTLGQYKKSLDDCEMVVKLNSVHFSALNCMGLCHAALGNYSAAIAAFRRALEIQPYALENQRLILECTARLS
jgi:tetratricopeptide (TPR) repeat protein